MRSLSAGTLATVVAVPVALVAGVVAFQIMRPEPQTTPTPQVQATTAVTVAAGTLSERQATVCRAFVSKLPDKIDTAVRRPVSSGPEQNAAYGDPAMVIRCGASVPTIADTDFLMTINAVCWHSATVDGNTVFTTVDREVAVQVTVPSGYQTPAQWVSAPALAAATAIPTTSEKIPSGCGG